MAKKEQFGILKQGPKIGSSGEKIRLRRQMIDFSGEYARAFEQLLRDLQQ